MKVMRFEYIEIEREKELVREELEPLDHRS